MRKLAMIGMGLFISTWAFADCKDVSCALDKVAFQVAARQWVTTQTALLTVNINVTLNNPDVVQVRAEIMSKLSKIAAGEWHVTQFDRSEDSSGMEKLFVAAQARIPQANLTGIYQNAKNNSKPGATYTVSGVEFKPGLEEFQKIKGELRERLYRQVNDELARLNKVYPNQNYSLNSLSFVEGESQPMYRTKQNMVGMAAASAPSMDTSVSNEINMTAMVEVASNRLGGTKGANSQ